MTPSLTKAVQKTAGIFVISTLLTHCSSDDVLPAPRPMPQLTAPPAQPQNKDAFQVGDQLELFVKEDSTLNGSYIVREGGYIVIPRIGRLNVVGLTREEAEPKVKEFLQKTQLTEANVIVERNAKRAGGIGGASPTGEAFPRVLVYLTGRVPRSGGHSIPVPPGKTVGVYEALLISGGFSKFATLQKVEVFRFDATGKRKKTIVDLRPVIKGEAEDPPISEGDIINVPEKVFGF